MKEWERVGEIGSEKWGVNDVFRPEDVIPKKRDIRGRKRMPPTERTKRESKVLSLSLSLSLSESLFLSFSQKKSGKVERRR